MGRTQLGTANVGDGSVGRDDLNATVAGQAVVRKIIAGSGVTLSQTGPDTGTGDVTISVSGGGGSITVKTLDFGAFPVFAQTFFFAHAGALTSQNVVMQGSAKMPGTLSPDELEMDGLVCAAYVSAADVITAVLTASPGPVSGLRTFNYQLI
jgi:hypothetical protein